MKSLARHKGIDDEFEGFGSTHRCILPPEDASEVEINTYQVKETQK